MIQLNGTCGSSPISVVEHALLLFDRDRATGEIYNKIYCVFDRDSHASYDQALEKVQSINRSIKKIKLRKNTFLLPPVRSHHLNISFYFNNQAI